MVEKKTLFYTQAGLYNRLTEIVRLNFFNVINVFDDTITLQYYAAYHIIQMILDVKNRVITTEFIRKRSI